MSPSDTYAHPPRPSAGSSLLTAALLLAGGLLPAAAHGSELRFIETTAGQVVATGNTLGLSKEFGANGPGLEDSIGTFLSLDPASVDDVPINAGNPWPAGTTNDWTLNGSEAELVLPLDVEVLYAELVWGGSSAYDDEDVTASLSDPVTLGYGPDTELASPDAVTALDISELAFSGFPANYYMRSAEVTAFVQAHGAGTYSVSGVPATQTATINSLNAAGWTLLVAYRDTTQPIRNLTVFVGGSFVDEDTTEDYDFAGFCTPPSGAFEGRAVVTTIEGDADLTGDSFEIAETVAGPFVPLSGPNNPASNFFCSQLNDQSGQLDMAGTFGNANQDAAGGFNVVGGRQGWDVTTVTLSSATGQLANGQTQAVLRANTTGDSFVPTAVGFAIEVNAPSFASAANQGSAMPLVLGLGDSSTTTIDLSNDGLVDATGLVFRAALPAGLELTAFSIDGANGDIGGAPVDTAGLSAGVAIGDIAAGQTKQLQLEVTATAPPAGGDDLYAFVPQWDYDYVSCAGEPPLTETYALAPIVLEFDGESGDTGTDTGSADGTTGEATGTDSATGADSASGGASGSGGLTDTGTDGNTTISLTTGVLTGGASGGAGEPSDGCGCRSRGEGPGSRWWLWLLPAVALRRRARR